MLCPSGLWDELLGTAVPISSFRDCERSSSCPCCHMLMEILRQGRPQWLTTKYSLIIKPCQRWLFNSNLKLHTPGPGGTGPGAIRLVDGDTQIDLLQLYRHIAETEKLSLNSLDKFQKVFFGEGLAIPQSSDSDATFERAALWAKDCADNHLCQAVNRHAFMPSRLLELNSRRKDIVTLVESSTIASSPYAALSYCWGSDLTGVITTKKSSVASHMQGVEVNILPKTIQDAIKVCARLQIRYVWVDALCIIQDDPDDWRQEAAQMVEVYSNSLFTIAACEPSSCKQGFLGPQRFGSPEWQSTISVEVPAALGGPANQLLLRDAGVEDPVLFTLNSRAWCLQESVLPKRILGWDGCEMSWRCLEKVMCECGHLDGEDCGDYPELRSKDERGHDYYELQKEWIDLVTQYSQRSLTRSSDKLVAISGVAALFQRKLAQAKNMPASDEHTMALFDDHNVSLSSPLMAAGGVDEYFAGLWKGSFLPNLAWAVDHVQLAKTAHKKHSRYESYCAPTWSWASVDGPVVFRHMERYGVQWDHRLNPRLSCDVAIKDISCELVSPRAPLGAISSASVTLTGPLVSVELAVLHRADDPLLPSSGWAFDMMGPAGTEMAPKNSCFVRTERLQSWRVCLDVEKEPTIKEGSSKGKCWRSPQHDREGCGCVFDAGTRYACLRLLTYDTERSLSLDFHVLHVIFLVLEQVPGHVDRFKRIGLGYWTTQDAAEDPGRGFEMFSDTTEKSVNIV